MNGIAELSVSIICRFASRCVERLQGLFVMTTSRLTTTAMSCGITVNDGVTAVDTYTLLWPQGGPKRLMKIRWL